MKVTSPAPVQNSEPRTQNSPRRIALLAVVLITLVGLVLRIYALGHGLPFQYVPDESTMVGGALRMGATRSLQPSTFIYPALLMYTFAAEYLGLLGVGRLTGLFASVEQFKEYAFVDPTLFYLLPRLAIALAGTATLPVAYLLGRRLYGTWAGVVSAALLAASVMHVQMSHQARHWVPVTLLALIVLWVSLDLAERGRRRDYLLSGVLVGLAGATSFNGMLLLLLPVVAHLQLVRRRNSGSRDVEAGLKPAPGPLSTVGGFETRPYTASPPGKALRLDAYGVGSKPTSKPRVRWATHLPMVTATLLAFAVFFALNPYILLQFGQFSSFQTNTERSIGGQILWHLSHFQEEQGFVFFAEATLAYEPAITLLGIAGALLAVRRFRPTASLVLIYPPFHYFAFAALSPSLEQRYMLPAVALWALPAGLAGERALRWLWARLAAGGSDSRRRRPAAGLLTAAVGLLLAALVAAPAVRYDWVLSQTDTRTLAKVWIESTLPAGADLAVESYPPPLTPDLSSLRSQQRAEPRSLGAREQWLLEKGLPSGEVPFTLARLNLVDTSPAVDNLSPYLETHAHRYFVVSDFRWKSNHRGHQALKAYLARYGQLIGAFTPSQDAAYVPSDVLNNMEDPLFELWKVERPGPRIEIFEVPR